VHGWFLIAKGDFEQAIAKMEQALQLDPLSLPIMINLADAYGFAGKFEEALAQYDKIIEIDPNFRRGYEGKGMVYMAMGDYENAIVFLEQYQKMIGNPLKGLSGLGHAYAMAGYEEKAKECLDKMDQRAAQEPDKLFYMDYVFVHSGLKDYDKALYYLNKTFDSRTGIACLGMIFCIRYPMMKELRMDDRFKELTRKMGFEVLPT
jgi:adenylate cyclase